MQISAATAQQNKNAMQSQPLSAKEHEDFYDFLKTADSETSGEGGQGDEAWMPDRLKSLTLQRASILYNCKFLGGMYDPSEAVTIELCPQWYSDLADMPIKLDTPELQLKAEEYYKKLKAAMEQVLDDNNIPADSWGEHYASLIADERKSEKIHAQVKDLLYNDPRSVDLMNELGILPIKGGQLNKGRFLWEISEMDLSASLAMVGSQAVGLVRIMMESAETNMNFFRSRPESSGGRAEGLMPFPSATPPSVPAGLSKNEALDCAKRFNDLLREAHDEVTRETGFYSLDQNKISPAQRKDVLRKICGRFKENPEAQEIIKKMGMTEETSYGLPVRPGYLETEMVMAAKLSGEQLEQLADKIQTKEEVEAVIRAAEAKELEMAASEGAGNDGEITEPEVSPQQTAPAASTTSSPQKLSATTGPESREEMNKRILEDIRAAMRRVMANPKSLRQTLRYAGLNYFN